MCKRKIEFSAKCIFDWRLAFFTSIRIDKKLRIIFTGSQILFYENYEFFLAKIATKSALRHKMSGA